MSDPVINRADPDEKTSSNPVPVSKHPLLVGFLAGLFACLLVVMAAPLLREGLVVPSAPTDLSSDASDLRSVERRVAQMSRRLQSAIPRYGYLIVSSSDNTFRLMSGGNVVREGLCSTGSYVQLREHEGREWLFETPRGAFRILDKRRNPVWVKPDWAFVESGEPIPPPGSASRYERGVLGEYAMGLGDGYLIHGTLYQRLLGSPVTHGCVRLGDDDLEAAYRTLAVGARVYIY